MPKGLSIYSPQTLEKWKIGASSMRIRSSSRAAIVTRCRRWRKQGMTVMQCKVDSVEGLGNLATKCAATIYSLLTGG